jgi:DNA-binding MarR family transcriptional regulator
MFKDRIIALLRNCPHGLTSTELAHKLGTTTGKVSSPLSKLAMYGVVQRSRSKSSPSSRIKYSIPIMSAGGQLRGN